jgi:hypothetical protein
VIEVRYVGAEICPLMVCDHCAQPIDRAEQGIVTWSDGLELRCFHKGMPCDDRSDPCSYELGQFLADLVWNSGLAAPAWPRPAARRKL